MKKLIIAATVAMLGIAVNAASCGWSTNWTYALNDGEDDTYNNGMAGSYWIVALGTGSIDDISVNTAGQITVGVGSTVRGATEGTTFAGGLPAGTIEFNANGELFALVVYNSDYQMFGVSESAAISGYSDDPPVAANDITFSNIHDVTYDSDYMVANQSAVPEPTSGLLLLLGVAGLALRRRRA